MKHLMHILFLSCIKATELIEKKFHIELSFKERLQLKIHKMMCKACTNYEKHSTVLEHGIQLYIKTENLKVDVSKLKEDIILKLKAD
jgi:hypothetical protein